MRLWNRELATYPEHGTRRLYLLLVVLITVALYYELYVGGGVATLMLPELKIPFPVFVYVLAAGNLLGAFASLLAGLADRFGRANLVVYGLLLVGLITLFWMPNLKTTLEWGIATSAVAFVEGIVLVATPALIRDFSPQVGRATAMGFWTVGPVLGSLAVSAVNTATLPYTHTWQSQFVICGVIGLVIFLLAFLFLRELAPNLRDQVMVSERDRVLVELKAKGLDIEASLRNPWRQMMHLDVIASALGVSTLLLFYYTAVGFGIIYLVTVFQFSVADANALSNWSWGVNALALIVAGLLSDRLRVRKPFMLVGGIGGVVDRLAVFDPGRRPSLVRNTGADLLRAVGVRGRRLCGLDGELHRNGRGAQSGADGNRACDLGLAAPSGGDGLLCRSAGGGQVRDAADRGALCARRLQASRCGQYPAVGRHRGSARRDQAGRRSRARRMADLVLDLHRRHGLLHRHHLPDAWPVESGRGQGR